MLWIVLSLFTAFFQSLGDVFCKRGAQAFNEYIMGLALVFFSLPLLIVLVIWQGVPSLGPQFWPVLIATALIDVANILCYLKAIRFSDLSLVLPMLTFTPLFLLVTSPLLVGEFPTGLGLLGVVLIVVGAYLLGMSKGSARGIFAPFVALLRERGARLMLLVAFCWSIAVNLDKTGIQQSSPLFWLFSLNTLLFVLMLIVVGLAAPRTAWRLRGKGWLILAPAGFFVGIALICQMFAITLTLVPYVVSIKRTSVMMSVVWGSIFFHEAGLRSRLPAAALMVVGTILITLA